MRRRYVDTGGPTLPQCLDLSSKGLKKVGVANPVFLLDEIDKVGGLQLPRRPLGGDARGPGSGAEQHIHRITTSTSRST